MLDDWLDPAIVARGRQACAVVVLMDELARSEQKDPTGRAPIALWGRPRERASCHSRGRRNPQQGRALEKANCSRGAGRPCRPDRRAPREIVEAWQAVNKVGGHPDAEPHRTRAQKAANALKALESLAALPQGEDEASDRALQKTWATCSEFLDGCTEADTFLARARAAKGRGDRLRELKKRIDQADLGQGTEPPCSMRPRPSRPDTVPASPSESARLASAFAASTALGQALSAPQPSDLAIADAAELARSGGTWPADPVLASRCELAIRRRDLLLLARGDLDGITLGPPGRPVVRSVGQCAPGRLRRRPRASGATRPPSARNTAFADLERGLSGGDAIKVKRLARSATLADHPGLLRRKAEIDALIARSEQVERLLAAVRSGHAEAFLAEADPALSPPIRVSSPLFANRSLPGSMPGSAGAATFCVPLTRCFFRPRRNSGDRSLGVGTIAARQKLPRRLRYAAVPRSARASDTGNGQSRSGHASPRQGRGTLQRARRVCKNLRHRLACG